MEYTAFMAFKQVENGSVDVTPSLRQIQTGSTHVQGAFLGALIRFLNIFGDPWSVLLLRDAFLGVRRFQGFRAQTGITRQTLSARLKLFVDNGVLRRVPYSERPQRFEYRLTKKGFDLYRFAFATWRWSTDWDLQPPTLPENLYRYATGGLVEPDMVCTACRTAINIAGTRLETKGVNEEIPTLGFRARRWAGSSVEFSAMDANIGIRTAIIGDRWVSLILASILLGIHSFDRLVATLKIATNILAHRLKLMTEHGLLHPPEYNQENRSYDYYPTPVAVELLPLFVTMTEWTGKWETPDGAHRPIWRHLPCGAILQTSVLDRNSGALITAADVYFGVDDPPAGQPS